MCLFACECVRLKAELRVEFNERRNCYLTLPSAEAPAINLHIALGSSLMCACTDMHLPVCLCVSVRLSSGNYLSRTGKGRGAGEGEY